MSGNRETARERALRRAAEAAGAVPSPPGSAARAAVATPEANQSAGHGDVVKVAGRLYAIARYDWIKTGWAYELMPIKEQGRRLGAPIYHTELPHKALTRKGSWEGSLIEGATGAVIPSEQAGTTPASTSSGEARGERPDMATITRKGGKKSAAKTSTKSAPAKKAATKTAAASNRRSTEDIDALVPDIVKDLQAGVKMNEVKAKHGFSHGQPIRQALARNGFDSKGNSLAVEPITGTGKTLAGKVAKRREAGEAWYILARATGKTEGELRALLTEHGFSAEGRTYRAPAPKAAPAKKSPAKKSAAAKAKEAAADPS